MSPRSRQEQAQPPRYDQVQVEDKVGIAPDGAHPWQATTQAAARTSTATQAVQRELTAARKADARLRRLASERELRARQWEQFKVNQKKNFIRQKRQFQEDIEKLDGELQLTAEQGQAAAERMKLIVLQGVEAVKVPEAAPDADDMEWEQMISEEARAAPPAGVSRCSEIWRTCCRSHGGCERYSSSSGPWVGSTYGIQCVISRICNAGPLFGQSVFRRASYLAWGRCPDGWFPWCTKYWGRSDEYGHSTPGLSGWQRNRNAATRNARTCAFRSDGAKPDNTAPWHWRTAENTAATPSSACGSRCGCGQPVFGGQAGNQAGGAEISSFSVDTYDRLGCGQGTSRSLRDSCTDKWSISRCGFHQRRRGLRPHRGYAARPERQRLDKVQSNFTTSQDRDLALFSLAGPETVIALGQSFFQLPFELRTCAAQGSCGAVEDSCEDCTKCTALVSIVCPCLFLVPPSCASSLQAVDPPSEPTSSHCNRLVILCSSFSFSVLLDLRTGSCWRRWTFAPFQEAAITRCIFQHPHFSTFNHASCESVAPKMHIGGSGMHAQIRFVTAGFWQDSTWAPPAHSSSCSDFTTGSCAHPVCQGQRDVSVARGRPLAIPDVLPAGEFCALASWCQSSSEQCQAQQHRPLSWLLNALLLVASCLIPLGRSLAFCMLLGLLAQLVRHTSVESTPLGRLLSFPANGALCFPLRALGGVSQPKPVLDWSPRPRRRNKPGPYIPCRRNAATTPTCSRRGFLASLLSLPVCIHGPSVLLCSAWTFPHPAAGMTRPWDIEMPDSLPPARFVPVAAAVQQGVTDVVVPWQDAERVARAQNKHRVGPLPWDTAPVLDDTHQHLGVYLYTPHYKPQAFAVPVSEGTSIREVLDTIIDCAPGDEVQVCDFVIPVVPQRCPGFLYAIRMPSIARGLQGGMAGVIIDLTAVGGHYFATFLPKSLPHKDLTDFAMPLTKAGVEELFFFIGHRTKPWPACAEIQLRDGEVVTAYEYSTPLPRRLMAENLLQPGRVLGPMRHFFDVETHEHCCVLYKEKRYTIPPHHFAGKSILTHFAEGFHLPEASLLSCNFRLQDLDVHGAFCPWITAIIDAPAVREGDALPDRCDYFALCDFRPLGCKPHVVHSHVPLIHVPSLLSDLGILLSPAFEVGVLGGKFRDDHVKLGGNARLVFYAKLRNDSPGLDSGSEWEELDRSPNPALPRGPPPPVSLSEPEAGSPPWDHSWPGTADQVMVPQGDDTQPVRFPCAFQGTYIDGTLPEGQGWNEGVENVLEPTSGEVSATGRLGGDAPFIPPPTLGAALATPPCERAEAAEAASPDVDASEEEEQSGSLRSISILVLVYAPEYSPEMHTLKVQVPCGVDTLLAAVRCKRLDETAASLPTLTPAAPQLHQAFVTLVASPTWPSDRVVVILDCHRIDGRVFSIPLQSPMNRESLLLAAGFPPESTFGVFVHGLYRPLERGHLISLVTGMTIAFLYEGLGAPLSQDLGVMLLSTDWRDSDADLPGPPYHPGSHFRLLTDGMPTVFQVQDGRRSSFREDVAAALQASGDRLTIQVSKPRIQDAFPAGYLVSGVLIVTEQLSRVPWPPARKPERRIPILFDCRRILGGFRWELMPNNQVLYEPLRALFRDACPLGYEIAVRGPPLHTFPEGNGFLVEAGQVLDVVYVPAQTNDQSGTDDNDMRPPTGHGPNDDGTHDGGDTALPDAAMPATETVPTRRASHRSRSPRQQRQPGGQPTALATSQCKPRIGTTACMSIVKLTPRGEYGNGGEDTYAVQTQSSDGRIPDRFFRWRRPVRINDRHIAFQVRCRCGHLFRTQLAPDAEILTVMCKLLQEPTPGQTPSDHAMHNARVATRRLGFVWPLRPATLPLADGPEAAPDEQAALVDEGLVSVTFVILIPEYVPEYVDMQLLLPQTPAEALEVLETCRNRTTAADFPLMTPAAPQPDPRHAYILATPEWAATDIILCCDLTMIDGRIFAIIVPPDAGRATLLNAAGFSAASDIEIHVPGHGDDVAHDEHPRLSTGMCVSLVHRWDLLFSLRRCCALIFLGGHHQLCRRAEMTAIVW